MPSCLCSVTEEAQVQYGKIQTPHVPPNVKFFVRPPLIYFPQRNEQLIANTCIANTLPCRSDLIIYGVPSMFSSSCAIFLGQPLRSLVWTIPRTSYWLPLGKLHPCIHGDRGQLENHSHFYPMHLYQAQAYKLVKSRILSASLGFA